MHIRLVSSLVTTVVFAAACLLATSVWAHTGSGIVADAKGQVYFLDTGSGPWKIDSKGAVSRLPGPRYHWMAIDRTNAFAKTTLPTGASGDIVRSGTDPTLLLSSDYPIAIGQDGNLYYPSGRAGSLKMMRMKPSGETSVLATLPETSKGPLPHVNGIAAGPDGSIYYTENDVIRRISSTGEISIMAKVPALEKGPSIPGTSEHPLLRGLEVDAKGVMYVADNGDARVLKISADGKTITTLLQLESPWSPTAVALSGEDVYVMEFLHTDKDDRLAWLPRVRKITPDGKSIILATVDKMPGAR